MNAYARAHDAGDGTASEGQSCGQGTHAHPHARTRICTCARTHAYRSMARHIHTCGCMCIHTCARTYTYTYTCTHMRAHIHCVAGSVGCGQGGEHAARAKVCQAGLGWSRMGSLHTSESSCAAPASTHPHSCTAVAPMHQCAEIDAWPANSSGTYVYTCRYTCVRISIHTPIHMCTHTHLYAQSYTHVHT